MSSSTTNTITEEIYCVEAQCLDQNGNVLARSTICATYEIDPQTSLPVLAGALSNMLDKYPCAKFKVVPKKYDVVIELPETSS